MNNAKPTIAKPQPPEPVDLTALRERAQTYVLGLEARLASLKNENESLRAELKTAHTDNHTDCYYKAYRDGWSGCAQNVANLTNATIVSLRALSRNAIDAPPMVHQEPDCEGGDGCMAPEPHRHGFACDKTCMGCAGYCHDDCPANG